MPGTSFESDSDFDPQDQAEAFDESMTVGGEGSVSLGDDSPAEVGEEMRTFEEMPDVYDVTQMAGDRDEDEELALDADEFDEDATGDGDYEDDLELAYPAVDGDRQDELDGQGAEDSFNDDALDMAEQIEGLDEQVLDAGQVTGGEDDFTDFQARDVSDEDLIRMGYSERGEDGEVHAKPADE
jgi:hypothetical protein